MSSFTGKMARVPTETDIVGLVKRSMHEVLGESPTLAVICNVGGDEALKDPAVFERRLRDFFGEGAEVILKHILENAFVHREASEHPRSTLHERM